VAQGGAAEIGAKGREGEVTKVRAEAESP